MNTSNVVIAWGRILAGSTPLLSIEITRECPLSCPGCYAYGDTHLGGDKNLRDLSDFRGDELVDHVLQLVRHHKPAHVSLVGGEPMMRHRELNLILPAISAMGIWSMVVTSGVIPIPPEWNRIPSTTITVSVDGLPEHHDIRRKPATYERILRNIAGCIVNIHLTITNVMMERDGYLDEYFSFWSERPEVRKIWVSTYSPQMGENTPEMLTAVSRQKFFSSIPGWRRRYPKLLMAESTPYAMEHAPASPRECTFALMSTNYTADLNTRVEPCIFGGTPDCSQCGCAISVGALAVKNIKIAGPFRIGHIVNSSVRIGKWVARLRPGLAKPVRWEQDTLLHMPRAQPEPLVQINPADISRGAATVTDGPLQSSYVRSQDSGGV